jgi:anti-anti-sigma regulatory factor
MDVRMTTNAACIEREIQTLRQGAEGDVVLDFSSVPRIDPKAVTAMEELAGLADARSVKVVLRAVNMDIYKVLKLMNLAQRFAFRS